MQAAGRQIRSIAGHTCFLPDHLPPAGLELSGQAKQLHEEALYGLGKLEGASRLVPNPKLLTYALLALESIASSRIEGTVASPDELVLFQLEPSGWDDRVREVGNHNAALDFGIEAIVNRDINLSLTLELHAILMNGVRGETHAGKLKTKQNFIGERPGDSIEDAIYVPPPPEFTLELMENLFQYLGEPNRGWFLAKVAISHYQFEAIHPFGDGNGRIGRLLVLLAILKEKLLSRPLVHPSAYLERHRATYFGHLKEIQENGDWNPWIEFFLTAIIHQVGASIALIDSMALVREDVREGVKEVRRSSSTQRVIDAFFDHPVQTVASASKLADLSINATRSSIEDLEALGILREITGKRSGRAYVCQPIWRAIFK